MNDIQFDERTMRDIASALYSREKAGQERGEKIGQERGEKIGQDLLFQHNKFLHVHTYPSLISLVEFFQNVLLERLYSRPHRFLFLNYIIIYWLFADTAYN